jgi:hypothetical protein
MKYIVTLHNYIHQNFLLFNPTSLDKFCVKATHLENRGKHVQEDPTNKPSNLPHNPFKKFKRKKNNAPSQLCTIHPTHQSAHSMEGERHNPLIFQNLKISLNGCKAEI